MIEIRKVTTKKEQKDFLDFPLKLYKNCPYYVPALYVDEKKLFTKKNTYRDQAEDIFFNAYKDGKMVGRIQGILQKAANEKWNQKRVRFTRYDVIEDQEVSTKLLEAVEAYARSLGMTEVVGPLGYSDLDREGLLIEGFDELATFEESYNYSYYQGLLEHDGYHKEVDWEERQITLKKGIDPRIHSISEKIMKRYDLHYGQAKNTKDFLDKYADGFFEILDTTYVDIYGTVPFTDAMKKMLIDNFKLIIDIEYVTVVLDKNEKIVCFGLCFPSLAKAMQKSGGHLTPRCLIRLLKDLKHPEIIDMALVGVDPEWKSKGVAALIFDRLITHIPETAVYAETNLNLEDNYAILNMWKNFDARMHKKRRCFVKRLEE